ncbi:DUF4956 domain-containing protein [bacterium]|nr:DUF4956 domain-containing protein [bacterium]
MFDTSNVFTPLLSGYDILFQIGLAFLLSIFISFVYKMTHKGVAYSRSYIMTLILLALVTAMVMIAIGNNIARAFSLVGALSIIRFRTVVKDNKDTAFVFYSLAAGIACGSGALKVAIIGTVFIGVILLLLNLINYGYKNQERFLLKFMMLPDGDKTPVYQKLFEKFLERNDLVQVKSLKTGFIELSFNVQFKNTNESTKFVAELGLLEGVDKVFLFTGEDLEEP